MKRGPWIGTRYFRRVVPVKIQRHRRGLLTLRFDVDTEPRIQHLRHLVLVEQLRLESVACQAGLDGLSGDMGFPAFQTRHL